MIIDTAGTLTVAVAADQGNETGRGALRSFYELAKLPKDDRDAIRLFGRATTAGYVRKQRRFEDLGGR